jgi:hypothetical protein
VAKEKEFSDYMGLHNFTVDSAHVKMKLKLIYDRQSVGQSVLVLGAHLGPVAKFSFSLKFPSYSCMFVIL